MEASNLPMSIIIIGVGNASFSKMEELDSDGGRLRDNWNNIASRDLVQFVEFNKYKSDLSFLSEDVLREVPKQFVEYMLNSGISPSPVLHTDPNSMI